MVDLADHKLKSEPFAGRFWTAPSTKRDVRFVWSGDTAGQGWGIDLDWVGMKTYEALRRIESAFFIHSGDTIHAGNTIHADNPLEAEVALEDSTIWNNMMIEKKAKVAETLQEFRGN